MSDRQRDWAAGLAILAATLIAYVPAMSAGTIWDDQYYLTENLHLGSLEGLRRAWFVIGSSLQYYPMIHTSLWLEYWFFGMDPTGYHVDNILLHAANAILFWRLLRRLEVPGAWLAGAIFALHPVEVESVAWISERKNLLSTFFYLLSMHVYFRYESPEEGGARRENQKLHVVAFVLFMCALFSKTVTFSLPAAIALVFWWKRGRLEWASLRPLVPFVVAGALLGALTAWMEKFLVGAKGDLWDFSIVDRFLIAGRVVWFYFGKLVWPSDLAFSYGRWDIDASVAWQYVYPLAAVAVLAVAYLARDRIGRGPLTAMLFFGGTLFPALGFIDVFPFMYSFVADHFQYLASLGPIALIAAGSTHALGRVPWPAARIVIIGVLLSTLATLTWHHARVFHDPITLWTDVVTKYPSSAIGHNNLGGHLADLGDYRSAVEHNRETLEIDPAHDYARANLAMNLASMGRYDEAIEQFRIQLERFPDQAVSWAKLGHLLYERGRAREAIPCFERALELDYPDPSIEGRLRAARARSRVR